MPAQYKDPIDWEDSLPSIRKSSPAWRACIRALYGSPLSDDERAIYARLAGGAEAPADAASEAIFVVGRRGGKSEQMARLAVYEAIHGGHAAALAPGQVGIVAIIGARREQALEIIGYARGLVESTPALKRLLEKDGAQTWSIAFRTGITIKIITADAVSVRSGTLVCAILDEACFLPHDGAEPDTAIVAALRPGLAPLRGAPRRRMIAISSAGTRRGWVYEAVQAHHGHSDTGVMAIVATTTDANPNVDPSFLAAEKAKDPIRFAREYESIFSDIVTDGWLSADLAGATDTARTGSTPRAEGLRYHIGIDQAFGSGDGFGIVVAASRLTWADDRREVKTRSTHVVHVEGHSPTPGKPLSVHHMIERVKSVYLAYGGREHARVYIDQHCSAVLRTLLADKGIRAHVTPWTGSGENSKHARWSAVRDAMRSGELRLPNHPQLLSELANLRSTALPSGGERIEASVGHDDVAHAMCLAVSEALRSPARFADGDLTWYEREQADRRTWRNLGYMGYGPPCNRRA
jgi:hypothetical protein